MTGYFEQFAASVGSIVVSEIGDKVITSTKKCFFQFFLNRLFSLLPSWQWDTIDYIHSSEQSVLLWLWPFYLALLVNFNEISFLTFENLGYVIPQLIPKKWTIFLSMILFFFFGLKMIYEAYKNEEVCYFFV